MPNLRDLLPSTPVTANYKQSVVSVYNTNIDTVNNGGRCCQWTVPLGTTWAIFEVWSAGGDGAGACCCMGPYWGPGSGQYGKKTLAVTNGCTFTLCAAGTGCCAVACCGTCGQPSYVLCGTGGATALCAQGGQMGCVLCFRSYQGCTGICVPSCISSCGASGYDGPMQRPTITSPDKQSNYCWSQMNGGISGAPVFGTFRWTNDYCTVQLTRSGCETSGGSKFPGGPGTSARACGGPCCWGGWGAGGLVTVTYG